MVEPKEEVKEPEKSEVDKVKNDLAELKKANDDVEAELLRKEELRAKMAIGGESDAGEEPQKESEDEKYKREAKERYEGTGMSPLDDD